MFSKGDLIRCTRDGDIGVVLSTYDTESFIGKMQIYWYSDGFRTGLLRLEDNLFELLSPTKEKQ